jgi:Tol biopolymer transport system component
MPLAIGTRLGPYDIASALGAGGMGEVYRAHDTKLNRDVAIKILPVAFADDPDRLARFTREAQALAALNHPNIATIYSVDEFSIPSADSTVRALVMELVDGEDLSGTIGRGALPLAEALPIARQIADALEAAHEAGIVHRDLKPANIKIRADGTVKVLDFGLAKAMDPAGASGADAMNSPTLTARATQMGMIIGTAAYMAPEQARGRAVDRRADIWAFGVILYEILTGRRAFEGDDISVTLASVIKEDVRWDALPADLPGSIRRVLRRCLEKDPRKRLSAIADARLELDEKEPASASAMPAAAPARASLVSRLWPAAAVFVVTAALAAVFWPSTPALPAAPTRLSFLSPPGQEMYPDSVAVTISPDGTMVAFIAGGLSQSESELWVRSLDSMTARRLDDAAGANLAFWSPDSRRLGFFTIGGKLKTIAASGGRAETLCDAPAGRGGTWSPSNVIVFAPNPGGPLFKINAAGGTPEPATELDASKGEYGHRMPTFLPDGVHFLYAALPGREGKFDIYAGSLHDRSRTLVGSFEGAPEYADPGWLLFARQGVLGAQKFDAATLTLSGDPIPLADEPTSVLDPAISFTAGKVASASKTGALAYYSSPSLNTVATWYDLNGLSLGTVSLPPGHYETFSISPDGTHAAFVRSDSPSESSIWLADLVRGGATPLISGHGRNDTPAFSPDGKQIVFAADREGPQQLYVTPVDGGGTERPILQNRAAFKAPTAWSPDGTTIVFTQLDQDTAQNVYAVPAGGGEAKLLVRSAARDISGAIAPNGRWMAYLSEETGRLEVYLQSFPEPGVRARVSQQGGNQMWWTSDGRQLVYLGTDNRTLWRVDVDLGASVRIGIPVKIGVLPPNQIWVDAAPGRTKFLGVTPERTSTGAATVVLNWRAGLDQARR